MIKIVGIGGGTGLPVLLRGLKQLSACVDRGVPFTSFHVTAIVAVSDNGGSTGHLRRSFGIPAVGDLRNCLAALSDAPSELRELFQYRFPAGAGLQGHALGNLILSALWLQSGALGQAVESARLLLGVRGQVLPVTEESVSLWAEYESGEVIHGEAQIASIQGLIRDIWLEPQTPPPCGGVLDAIAGADILVLGPGSLYTSIVPNLLVPGVLNAIRNSPARKVFVCNLMTQSGETSRFSATDHIKVLEAYLGPGVLDVCVLNKSSIAPVLLRKYIQRGSTPVSWNLREIAGMGIAVVQSDLVGDCAVRVRHDPLKLARLIWLMSKEGKQIIGGYDQATSTQPQSSL